MIALVKQRVFVLPSSPLWQICANNSPVAALMYVIIRLHCGRSFQIRPRGSLYRLKETWKWHQPEKSLRELGADSEPYYHSDSLSILGNGLYYWPSLVMVSSVLASTNIPAQPSPFEPRKGRLRRRCLVVVTLRNAVEQNSWPTQTRRFPREDELGGKVRALFAAT